HGSTLRHAVGETADDLIAKDYCENDHGHHADGGSSHHLAEYRLILPGELGYHQRNGLGGLARKDEREKEFIPRLDEGKYRRRAKRWNRNRQHDVPEGCCDASAIDRRGFLQSQRDGHKETPKDPHHDRQIERQVNEAERENGIDHSQLAYRNK